jgi:hypothetical protein
MLKGVAAEYGRGNKELRAGRAASRGTASPVTSAIAPWAVPLLIASFVGVLGRSASMLGRWNPCGTSVAGHPEWRPCQRSSDFPHCLPSKVPQAPVFNEDQFSRVRVRPETRTERPKAGQEGFSSSLTFTRSHWRVGAPLFLTRLGCSSRLAFCVALSQVEEIFNADDQNP